MTDAALALSPVAAVLWGHHLDPKYPYTPSRCLCRAPWNRGEHLVDLLRAGYSDGRFTIEDLT